MNLVVKYYSNNSGGDWWLKGEDWIALEQAGWKVKWEGIVKGRFGVLRPKMTKQASTTRFWGALADGGEKQFEGESIEECVKKAIDEFEKITGSDVTEDGCSCCGPPHSFRWDVEEGHGSASGEELLQYLFPGQDTSKTKRELLSRK